MRNAGSDTRCYRGAPLTRLFGFGTALLGAILVLTALAAAAPRATSAPAATVPIKIRVSQDGFYRVPLSGIGGWTAPADRSLLHLKTGGADVPFQLHGSTLEFYGQGLDIETTKVRTYYFSLGATAGTQMAMARARTAAASPTAGNFSATISTRDRGSWIPKLVNGNGFNNAFGQFVCGCNGFSLSPQRTFNLTNVDTTANGQLSVTMQGDIAGASRAIDVKVNGTSVGTVNGNGSQLMSGGPFTVNAGTLVNGVNAVQFFSSGLGDRSYTDTYTLTYPHTYMADANRLAFPVVAATPVTVGGFTSNAIRVIDVTNPASPKELFGTVSGSGSDFRISVNPPAGTNRLYAFADSAALTADSAVLDNISDLKNTANQADLLIITHADFRPAIQPLIDRRTNVDGLTVFTTDVEDVYDEYSFGVHGPEALKDFIHDAKTNWALKPKWVLLVGDGSWDPRAASGNGTSDFVPTYFVDATFSTAPSDDWLADWDNNAIPELAVGRLPVRTAAQTTDLVSKIVSYAALPVSAPRREVLVAQEFQDYDFAGLFAEDLRVNTLVPRGVSVVPIYQPNGGNAAVTRADLINALNDNANPPTIVNYFGHGDLFTWHGSLFRKSDIPSLTNTRPALYLMMTCLNGDFSDPNETFNSSFTEALLLASGNRGAVASWASSGETVPGTNPTEDGSQRSAVKRAQEYLLDDVNATLGDAMLYAKGHASITNNDVRRTWVLLGDPSTKLR